MNKKLLSKLIVAVLGVGVTQAALADEITGSYVQGDLGLAYMKADTVKHDNVGRALKDSYNDSKLMPRVSVGYDFGDWRVAGDYTHYGTIDESNGASKSETKVSGAGLAAIYDFNTALPVPVTPYVGARLSVNKVKQETTVANGTTLSTHKDSSTKVSPGLLAGVNYKLDRNFTVDMGYRYNHLDSDVQVHEAAVGLRYTF
ncbi:opacity family porin [Alysiella crassa]|uniref:Outer membrane protein P.IIC n=1 Tax=Alysiella crassa TaxID=153491 RepID=A0A376BM79_9NEIS|nr:opacity family porin [Alysiella crassa]UOP07074.1 opacity family porin [Alysiella crassa]SSY70786.1 Outer membrane protein P.IIC precursor [Alysiella crassa]